MLPLPGLSPVSGKAVVARFDGGQLSSDAGVVVLRELAQRLGLAGRLAACIDDPRDQNQIVHPLAALIEFRMLMIASGYEDGNDATALRSDPAFKLAQGVLPSGPDLASQSTISRLENLPAIPSLLRMEQTLIDFYCASYARVPKRIVLDLDDTFDAVHGGQQLRLFNAHYDEYGFQPIVVFDGNGRFVAAVLRPARRPSGLEIRAFLRRLLSAIRANWPATQIMIRGDSHYLRSRGQQAPLRYAAPRSSISAGRTVSISSSALRQPQPCAAMLQLWRRAPRPVSMRAAKQQRCAATRSFTTALQAGAGWNGSSRASKRGLTAPTPASSSPIFPAGVRRCSTKTFTVSAAAWKTR